MLAKTDRLDARILAVLAESLAPKAKPPAPDILEELQELVRARQAAVADLTALTNQSGESKTVVLKRELARRARPPKPPSRVSRSIARRIEGDPALARRYLILLSIKGIGPVAAASLLVGLAELGVCSGKQVALLAGLAPLACDSGDKKGERHIKGGRGDVRAGISWPPSRPSDAIPTSKPSSIACVPEESCLKSPSPPSCASSSCSPTPSSARIDCGSRLTLDFQHLRVEAQASTQGEAKLD